MAQHALTEEWYYRMLGEEFGPVSRSALDRLIAEGQIGNDDEIRSSNSRSWIRVLQLTNSTGVINGTPYVGGTVFSLDSFGDGGLGAISEKSQSDEWFYESLGEDWGPFTFEELLDHAREGDISPDDQVRMGRNGKWRRAGSVGRLMAVMPYAIREAKKIPTGSRSPETPVEELKTRTPYREAPPPAYAPPPMIASPPPPPPPPLPPMAPPPPVVAMPAYVPPPAAPAWGYGQPAPAAPVNDQGWYAWLDSVECGPMDFQQFMNWGKSGRISPNDYVKQGKYSQWSLAKNIPGLIPAAALMPTPTPAVAMPVVTHVPIVAPEPPKSALKLPTPAPAPPPKPVAVEPPVPRPAASAPRPAPPPALPSDAPPEKKWTDEWGTSTVKSSYNPAAAAVAATPGAKKLAPPPKKKKSSGGGMDIGSLMKDVRVLGGIGVVLLGGLIFGAIMMMPESSGPLVAAHKELGEIYKEVEDKIAAGPDDKAWSDFKTKTTKKTGKISSAVNKSNHKAKGSITQVVSAINTAVKAKTAKDAGEKLKAAEKKLDAAKKALGI